MALYHLVARIGSVAYRRPSAVPTWIALLLRAWLEDVTHEIAQGRRVDRLPDHINPNPGHDPT
jgi:hypothetical protein